MWEFSLANMPRFRSLDFHGFLLIFWATPPSESKYSNTSKLDFWGLEKTGIANLGAYKRYRKFGGKEQREESRVREFREFETASLRGITVFKVCSPSLPILGNFKYGLFPDSF